MLAGRKIKTGRRIFIRKPTQRDEAEFLSLTRASRKLHSPWVKAPTTKVAFRNFLKRARRKDVASLLVCRSEDGAIVGVITISQIFLGNFKNAYLGYYGSKLHSGQGYMSEGMVLATRYAFDSIGLHRLEANIQPGNKASIRLVKRMGFRKEGYSPRYLKIAGKWRDHERWAMLAEER